MSITLLVTIAHQNKWDTGRLASRWGERQTDMLRTAYNKSLAATLKLSLPPLIFLQELGLNARDLLEAVAFFPPKGLTRAALANY